MDEFEAKSLIEQGNKYFIKYVVHSNELSVVIRGARIFESLGNAYPIPIILHIHVTEYNQNTVILKNLKLSNFSLLSLLRSWVRFPFHLT